MSESLILATVFLAAAFLFCAGVLVLVLALLVAGRALSAAAQGRAHLVQAQSAEVESVGVPDHEPSADPARAGGGYVSDSLERRPPNLPSDADLERAASFERNIDQATRDMLLRQAERGDYDVDDNVNEDDLVGATSALYVRGGR